MANINKPLMGDSNAVLFEGVYDATGHQFVAQQAGTVFTDGTNLTAPNLVQSNDGGLVTVGTTTDVAYGGSGAGSLVALLKSLYTLVNHSNPTATALVITGAATTTAASDNTYTFASQANHWLIQNNTTNTIWIKRDAISSQSALAIPPNGGTFSSDWPVTVVHIYTTVALAFNASGPANIYLEGVA